jgi:hypothetical protein
MRAYVHYYAPFAASPSPLAEVCSGKTCAALIEFFTTEIPSLNLQVRRVNGAATFLGGVWLSGLLRFVKHICFNQEEEEIV